MTSQEIPHWDMTSVFPGLESQEFRAAFRQATAQGAKLLLTGVMMGGGPCAWAAEAHVEAGYPVYATPDAARTFNDDLDEVAQMGVEVVGEDEAAALHDVEQVTMQDFDVEAIRRAVFISISELVRLFNPNEIGDTIPNLQSPRPLISEREKGGKGDSLRNAPNTP